MAQKKQEMVTVYLEKKTYPEVTMWLVTPKKEWEAQKKKGLTTEGILNLIEKQVTGKSWTEVIAELEKEVETKVKAYLARTDPNCSTESMEKLLELAKMDDPALESLRTQLRQLTEVMDKAEMTVEEDNGEEPMTLKDLDWTEKEAVRKPERLIWDSPSA